MVEIIIQYVLIVFLVMGLAYLAYLLKDKDSNLKDDYFGFASVILGSLTTSESTPENAKTILRIISQVVQNVEINYRNSDNALKEEKAIQLAKDATSLLGFKKNIDGESLKYLIRVAVALLPATNKTIK
ncbi:hypothetical protein LL033_18940 [Clostridium estertheticum]|uniref:hypothetical protein n=1 Tax=Clostridium estertheticum TaxID=238834 RepID=UPI001C0D7C8D|nr:hypothetical protein [Clostridium estertheticum]MBU3218328.1 hypothetical protein [Clostridium estertheticum]WAG54671.1 hypothetical protein LL033_18940 [Clostridium estertheticum]